MKTVVFPNVQCYFMSTTIAFSVVALMGAFS